MSLTNNFHHLSLKWLNVQSVAFETPEGALSISDKPDSHFDILLLNPDYAGKEQIARIVKAQPKARVFYLVNGIDLGRKVTELQKPASQFLSGPIKRATLYEGELRYFVGYHPSWVCTDCALV